MSTSDDDLVAALRRSDDPADRRIAAMLGTLSPAGRRRATGPRANEALASFLVGSDPAVARLGEDAATEPLPDLVVRVGPPAARRRSGRSPATAAVALLRTSLLAKAVLGAALALTGAGAMAATGVLPDGQPDTVVVTPASDEGSTADVETDEPALEQDADVADRRHGGTQDADGEPGGPGDDGRNSVADDGRPGQRDAGDQAGSDDGETDDVEHGETDHGDETDADDRDGTGEGDVDGDEAGEGDEADSDTDDDSDGGDEADGDSDDDRDGESQDD